MNQIALFSACLRLGSLVCQGEFGAQMSISLDQGKGKHFTQCFLKGLAVNPESLIVVALSHRKSHQGNAAAPCQDGVRGGMIKGCLRMTVVMLGAALEEGFAEHSQSSRRRVSAPLRSTFVQSVG